MARGCIDILNHQMISGWVVGEPNQPGGNNFVRIVMDGKELGTIRANLFRPDLRDAAISDGYSGFRFLFSQTPDPFADHKLELFDRDTQTAISPCPATLRSMMAPTEESMFEFDTTLTMTHIGMATFSEGIWNLRVELLSSKQLILKPRVRHGTIEHFERDVRQEENFLGTGLRRQAGNIQLRGKGKTDAIFLELLENAPAAGKYDPVCHIAIPQRIPSYLDDVTQENMARVSGPMVTRDLFAASGVNTAYRIDSIVSRHFGKSISEYAKIHDWGIGSGRVALPIKRMIAPKSHLSGSDVDAFNIEFGTGHYPDIEFVASPFYPPLPYKDGTFDLIYGISVITHLTEGAQFAWLKELRRLVKPGAPVILTVHGEYGIINAAMHDPFVLTSAASRGISDQMLDMNLGPKLRDKKYYRATFHTRKYIAQEWTEYFDVVAHYSCANVVVQDFVVLRAK